MENQPLIPQYTGQYDETVKTPWGEYNNLVESRLYPYYPDKDGKLVEAVNLAIRLNRPLLLEGEPGCGKSHLAHALVYEFSKKYPEITWKYRFWNIQSVSKAMDGFYQYDYIGRLQTAQLVQAGIKDITQDPAKPEKFVNLGALGQSFKESHEGVRSIVLIDEIDKADPDLPNDLLLALDAQKFEIKEIPESEHSLDKSSIQRVMKAAENYAPIIIITSNQERALPPAFLRRCLYHYIEFPSEQDLTRILIGRFGCPTNIAEDSIKVFMKLRQQMEEKGELGKKVSTSELIDWFQTLYDPKTQELRQKLDPFPHLSTLLKSRQDIKDYC